MDKALASIGERLSAHAALRLRPGNLPNTVLAIITAAIDAPFTDMEVREYVYENRISLLVRTGRNEEIRTITCKLRGRVTVMDEHDGRVGWRILLAPVNQEHTELLRALVECIAIESDEEFSRKSWTEFIPGVSVHAPNDNSNPRVGPGNAQEFPNEEFVEMYAVCDNPDEGVVWRDTIVPTLRDLGEDISHMSLDMALGAETYGSSDIKTELEEMLRRADEAFDDLWEEEKRVSF